MKLYQYALIWTPTEQQAEDDGMKPKIIKAVTETLAKDDNHARTVAARAIPDEYAEQIDQITIALRPF